VIDGLIGRDALLPAAVDLIGRSRLVTMVGTAGVGKTRFAIAAAAAAESEHSRPALFVPLAPIGEPSLVVGAIAAAAGLDTSGGRSIGDIIADAIAQHRLLLVLDNFEHVAAAATDVADLIDRCPALHVVVTSRVALGVRGEVELEVPPLDVPASGTDPGDLVGVASVELLVRSVRRFDPRYSVDAGNADVIGEICRRLDGLPLALELAAARLRLLSPRELTGMLGRRLDVLRSSHRDAAAHHHETLRSAIDWSYRLLDKDDRRLLRWLTVFSGGFTVHSAATVAGVDTADLLDQLDTLVAHHLVTVTADVDDRRRFDLFESIREFAVAELATEGEQCEARDSHAAWVAGLVERSVGELAGPEQVAARRRLDGEIDNIRAALAWTCRESESDVGLALAGPLWRYWWMLGQMVEGRRWIGSAVEGYRGPVCAALGWALLGAGRLADEQGDHRASTTLIEQACSVFETLGDDLGLADCWNGLGMAVWGRGDLIGAEALHLKALTVFRERSEQRRAISALNSLGSIAYLRGDLVLAESRYRATVDFLRGIDDRRTLGMMLGNVGNAVLARGDPLGAVALYEEALAIGRELDDTLGTLNGLANLGGALVEADELDRADDLLGEALDLMRTHGLVGMNAGSTLHTAGRVARARGDRRQAGERWLEALGQFESCGFTPGVAGSIESIAGLAVDDGRHADAASLLCWASASRDRDGSAPENDRGQAERDTAIVMSALGAPFDRCRSIAEAWTSDDVVAAATSVVAAIPDRAARSPTDAHRREAAKQAGLTQRELEILDHLVQRYTDREIADLLYVSVRTVTTHVSAVLRKLGVSSRRDVPARAVELGITST
jgi:non-specific serine/threonine protein kinase